MTVTEVAQKTGHHPITVGLALADRSLHGERTAEGWDVSAPCAEAWTRNEKCAHRRRPAPTGVGLPRLTISRNASAAIDSWAWGLADGSLHLAQLPGALFTFWNVAFASGRASRDHEVKALTAEANRLWLRCFGEKEREQFLLNRLDQAATLADRPDVDDVLDEAWRIYLAGLHNLRDPLRIRDTDLGRKVA